MITKPHFVRPILSILLTFFVLQSFSQTKEFTTGILGNANPLISMEMVKINNTDFHTWHQPKLMAFSPDDYTIYFRNPATNTISSWNLISLKRSMYLPSNIESYKEGREALAVFTPSSALPFYKNSKSYCWLDGNNRIDVDINKNYETTLTFSDTSGKNTRKFTIPNFTSGVIDWAKKKRYSPSVTGECLIAYLSAKKKLLFSVNYNLSNIISKYNSSFIINLEDGQISPLPCSGNVKEEPGFPSPHIIAELSNSCLIRYYNEEGGKRNYEVTSLVNQSMLASGTMDPDVVERIVAYDWKKQQVISLRYNNPYGKRPPSNKTYCLQWLSASGDVIERLWIDYGKDCINDMEETRMVNYYPLIISPGGRFFAFSGVYKPGLIENHYYGICYDLLADAKDGFMKSLHEPNLGKAVVPDNYLTAVINANLK